MYKGYGFRYIRQSPKHINVKRSRSAHFHGRALVLECSALRIPCLTFKIDHSRHHVLSATQLSKRCSSGDYDSVG